MSLSGNFLYVLDFKANLFKASYYLEAREVHERNLVHYPSLIWKATADFDIFVVLSGMTPMPDGQTILGVFPCLNEGNSTDFYNTMVQMNVTDPETVPLGGNPPFKRLGTGRLFYANEVYVSIAMVKFTIQHDLRSFYT
jgi:hypothetical protein